MTSFYKISELIEDDIHSSNLDAATKKILINLLAVLKNNLSEIIRAQVSASILSSQVNEIKTDMILIKKKLNHPVPTCGRDE